MIMGARTFRPARFLAAATVAGLVLAGGVAVAPAQAAAGHPAAPAQPTATAGDSSATLRWTAPADNGSPITGYVITANPTGQQVRIPADTSYTVGGLTNGTAYTFQVAATNANGTSAKSPASDPVTPVAPVVPDAPQAVIAVAGYGAATVSWTAPANDGGSPISGYTVTSSAGDAVTTTGEATSATVDGLDNGTAYTFTVVATNAVGDGPASVPSDPVTPAETVPDAPASITATSAGDGAVDVTWTSPDSDGGEDITGYTVTADPGGASATTDPYTYETSFSGLDDATAYTFSVVATNALGDGAPAVSVPTTPAVTVADSTVPLSSDSLDSLIDVDGDQTLTFEDAPPQVLGLQAGNVIVAGVSASTPEGLLRTVSSVSTVGDITTVATTDASLDDALSDGGLSLEGSLQQSNLGTFRPLRRGIHLAPAAVGGSPSLRVTIDTDIYDNGHGGTVHLEGSEELTPHVSFSASLHCCFHINSHFTASIEAESNLTLTAQVKQEIGDEDGIPLANITFDPIEFSVGPVPVVIVPELALTLQATGEVSVGLTTSLTHTDEFGVDLTTDNGDVDAHPINEHSTSFTPPTVFAGAEFKAGPRAQLTLYLYGVAGPYVQDTLYLVDISADTSEDPWWKLEVNNTIGVGFHISLLGHELADWSQDPLIEETFPIADAGGPFMGVSISPDPAQVKPGKSVQLTATVEHSRSQKVTWSVEPGGGTITAAGRYTAPSTPGTYQVTATSPANGLKPETSGVASVDVSAAPPGAPTSVQVTSNRYGQARVTWAAPTGNSTRLTGYEIQTAPDTGITTTPAGKRSAIVAGLTPHQSYTFQVRADNIAGSGPWSDPSDPVTISAYLPPGLGVLMLGTGDYGNDGPNQWLASTLTAAGYVVVTQYSDSLPSVIAPFAQIWDVSTVGLSTSDDTRLVNFAANGGGVYLTGERPCCESVNVSDMRVVNQLLPSAVQIGNLGDPFYEHGYVSVNPTVAHGVATTPNALSSWLVDAPGGMSGVAADNVFASAGSVSLGAVWGSGDLTGTGRVAVLMDINWAEPWEQDDTAAPIAQNLAFFLSGLSAPPAPAQVARSRTAAAAPKRRSPSASR